MRKLKPKWSIYNNYLPWSDLSDEQKGNLLVADNNGIEIEGRDFLALLKPVQFDGQHIAYFAVQPEPVKPAPTMEELFITDWESFSSRSDYTIEMMLKGHDAKHILASHMIDNGWNKLKSDKDKLIAELEKDRNARETSIRYLSCSQDWDDFTNRANSIFYSDCLDVHNLEQTRRGFWLGFESARCHGDEMNILMMWEQTKAFNDSKATKEQS